MTADTSPEQGRYREQTALELVGELWKKTLRVTAVRREDHFFECGGNSLYGMLLASRISAALGVELSLTTFFDTPTFGALWDEVRAAMASKGD